MRPARSIVHLLVVLALVPTVSLPAFSWLFIQDRLRVSADAQRVEDGLVDVAGLDRLGEAVKVETVAQLIQNALVSSRLSPAQQEALLRGKLTRSVTDRRTATDAALAQLRTAPLNSISGGSNAIEAIGQRLATTRDLTGAVPMMDAYHDITGQVRALERAAIYRISSGQLGPSSARLLRATGHVQAIGDLGLQVTLQQTQYVSMMLDGGDPARLADLAASSGSVDTLSAQLGQHLAGDSRLLWQTMLADPQLSQYLDDVRSRIRAGHNGDLRPVTSAPALVSRGNAALALSAQLSRLMATSISDAVTDAHHDSAVATQRARMASIGALLAMLATVAVLVVIGGTIRRRLSELADSAQRLSAGRLELMPVRGPREVALVSRGLNDAVRSLRHISLKADLISHGDISSPLLEQHSPGPLGAAVEASFQQVITTMRERERLQGELAHQATHDPLTGLANRAEAERRLRMALRDRRPGAGRIGLLFIDLDHFKECNDTYGHHAGDQVLQVCAQRMRDQSRAGDLACRIGGDEFVVILKHVADEVEAVRAGDRIVAAIREPIGYQDHELRVSASVGIALWPGRDIPPQAGTRTEAEIAALAEALLADADRALYRAKALGRDTAAW